MRRGTVLLAMGGLIYLASITCPMGADTNAPVAKTAQIKADAVAPAKKSEKKMLSGAELYSMNCNRCHAERYPTERTAAQWKTILLHMRVRANIPADQARTILKYLQENSGR
jgi:cytochrome c5